MSRGKDSKTKKKEEVIKMNYITNFILMAIIMSIIVGGFMAVCIVNVILEYSHIAVKWIAGIIIAVTIGCGISGVATLQLKGDNDAWNNGYCTECNAPYKFTSSVHHRNSDDEYYYTCNNCGHIIVIHSLKER